MHKNKKGEHDTTILLMYNKTIKQYWQYFIRDLLCFPKFTIIIIISGLLSISIIYINSVIISFCAFWRQNWQVLNYCRYCEFMSCFGYSFLLITCIIEKDQGASATLCNFCQSSGICATDKLWFP